MSKKYRRKQQSTQVSIWLPTDLVTPTKMEALRQDCSVSWLVTEALLMYLGIEQEELDKARGYSLTKEFSKRRTNPEWSPNTKASKAAVAKQDVEVEEWVINDDEEYDVYCPKCKCGHMMLGRDLMAGVQVADVCGKKG